eukprot:GHVS01036324.1.p1 GENE.GHVS01036324.1~~GHVS01036324.1.p1  ORF type:complete len:461 (-),score=17.13 GHVS01036324.1:898-2280(-)
MYQGQPLKSFAQCSQAAIPDAFIRATDTVGVSLQPTAQFARTPTQYEQNHVADKEHSSQNEESRPFVMGDDFVSMVSRIQRWRKEWEQSFANYKLLSRAGQECLAWQLEEAAPHLERLQQKASNVPEEECAFGEQEQWRKCRKDLSEQPGIDNFAKTAWQRACVLDLVKLTKFAGDTAGVWPGWLAAFEEAVSREPSSVKWYYLQQLLEGEALKFSRSYDIPGDKGAAYDGLIEGFKQIYGSTTAQVNYLISRLRNLKDVAGDLTDAMTYVEILNNISWMEIENDEALNDQLLSRLGVQMLVSCRISPTLTTKKLIPKLQEVVGLIKEHLLSRRRRVDADAASRGIGERTDTKSSTHRGCIFCNGDHSGKGCTAKGFATVDERRVWVTAEQRCFMCLDRAHVARECRSARPCYDCGGRHHEFLCAGKGPNAPEKKGLPPTNVVQDVVTDYRTPEPRHDDP